MQATKSKVFTTGLIAAMAMLALVASLFAVQPAFADDLAAGSMLGEQSKQPNIKVEDSASVTVGKTITIQAENLTDGQTGVWSWTVTEGSSLVQLSGTNTAKVKVKGVKGGDVTLTVGYMTDSGKKNTKVVKVSVYGIKSTIVKNGIVYKRLNTTSVKVLKTKDNKDIGKKSISVPGTIKLGDGQYKAKYKVTAIGGYSLNAQKKTTKITVGNNVKKIYKHAFSGNVKMTTLVIGTGVEKICSSIVKNCDKLKTITIKSKKLTKEGVKNCLLGNTTVKTVKVPASKVKKYQKFFTKKNCGANVKVVAI